MQKSALMVSCTDKERQSAPAKYKIAAEWIGGGYAELKTFGFADDDCLARVFQQAQSRAEKIRLSEGESISQMRVYELESNRHDNELRRREDLEKELLASQS